MRRQKQQVPPVIRELIESLRTPATKEARRLGYLYETIALKQRYRRCAQSWKSHIGKCHEITIKAVETSAARDCLLILGSGPLMEIPMPEMLKRFTRLVLADFVHPRDVRRAWAGHPQIELIEVDLLGIAAPLLRWWHGPLPAPQPPDLSRFQPDFVLSANCLSQLALKPRQHLEGRTGAAELDVYSELLSVAHLQQVKSLSAAHLVISDFETRLLNRQGAVVEKTAPFFNARSLHLQESWNWHLAPRGEISRHQSVEMSVGAFTVK